MNVHLFEISKCFHRLYKPWAILIIKCDVKHSKYKTNTIVYRIAVNISMLLTFLYDIFCVSLYKRGAAYKYPM